MQHKLKSVFRRSSKSRASSGDKSKSSTHPTEASSPRGDRHSKSPDRHGRTSVDSSTTGSVYTGRSRPVSSTYNDFRQSQASAKHSTVTDFASSDPNGGAIANDYKAYMPALSPVNDNHGDEISLSRNKRHITGESEVRQEENVADCKIARHSTSIDGGYRDLADVAHHGSARVTLGKCSSRRVFLSCVARVMHTGTLAVRSEYHM